MPRRYKSGRRHKRRKQNKREFTVNKDEPEYNYCYWSKGVLPSAVNVNTLSIILIQGKGHNFYSCLTAQGQGGDKGGTDAPFLTDEFNTEGDTFLTANQNLGHIENKYYFKNIKQTIHMRNVDLNPCFLTAYYCVIRRGKLLPGIGGAVNDLRRFIITQLLNSRELTSTAGDSNTAGVISYTAPNTYITARAKDYTPFSSSEFCKWCTIKKVVKRYLVPGQSIYFKSSMKAHMRKAKDCLPETFNIEEENYGTVDTGQDNNVYYANSTTKGQEARFWLFDVRGELGIGNTVANVAGYVTPTVVYEYTDKITLVPTVYHKDRWQSTYSSLTEDTVYKGPSAFVEQT